MEPMMDAPCPDDCPPADLPTEPPGGPGTPGEPPPGASCDAPAHVVSCPDRPLEVTIVGDSTPKVEAICDETTDTWHYVTFIGGVAQSPTVDSGVPCSEPAPSTPDIEPVQECRGDTLWNVWYSVDPSAPGTPTEVAAADTGLPCTDLPALVPCDTGSCPDPAVPDESTAGVSSSATPGVSHFGAGTLGHGIKIELDAVSQNVVNAALAAGQIVSILTDVGRWVGGPPFHTVDGGSSLTTAVWLNNTFPTDDCSAAIAAVQADGNGAWATADIQVWDYTPGDGLIDAMPVSIVCPQPVPVTIRTEPVVECSVEWFSRCDDQGGGTVVPFYRAVLTCTTDGAVTSQETLGDYVTPGDFTTEYAIVGTETSCGLDAYPDAEGQVFCDEGTGLSFVRYTTVISDTSITIVETELDGITPYAVVGPITAGACPLPTVDPDVEQCGTRCQIGFDGRFINLSGGFAGLVLDGVLTPLPGAPFNGGQALADAATAIGVPASYLGFVNSDIQIVVFYGPVEAVQLGNGETIVPACEPRQALLVKVCNDDDDAPCEVVTSAATATAGTTSALTAGARYTIFVTSDGFELDGVPIPCGATLQVPDCCGCVLAEDTPVTAGDGDITVVAEAEASSEAATIVRTKTFLKPVKQPVEEIAKEVKR